MNRRFILLSVGAAFVVGVLSLGGCGNKEESASPTSSEGGSSTTTQQAHNLGIMPDTRAALDAAFKKSFKESGAPGAVAAVRTPDGMWVGTLG
jgi:hypothetical protein